MPKLTTLTDITSGYLSNEQISSNFDLITTAFANTVSRDGSSPNTITANIDMNSKQLINLVAPTSDLMAATKKYVDDNTGTIGDATAAAAAATISAAAALASEVAAAASEKAAAASAATIVLPALGAANTVLQVNSGGTALEYGKADYVNIQDVSTTDRLLGRSTAGAGVIEEITCTSFARTILDDTTAAAVRTTLGIVAATGAPTAITSYTSGSGNFTILSASFIVVCAGAGGGGAGSETNAGSTGGTTTFSGLSAGGGTGGVQGGINSVTMNTHGTASGGDLNLSGCGGAAGGGGIYYQGSGNNAIGGGGGTGGLAVKVYTGQTVGATLAYSIGSAGTAGAGTKAGIAGQAGYVAIISF